MTNYKKMYLTLFNAITDAFVKLNHGRIVEAMVLLIKAQQSTENMYSETEPNLILIDRKEEAGDEQETV